MPSTRPISTTHDTDRPRLAPHVRLTFDPAREQHVLLSPETVVVLNATAATVLDLCDGERTVAAIVAELRAGTSSTGPRASWTRHASGWPAAVRSVGAGGGDLPENDAGPDVRESMPFGDLGRRSGWSRLGLAVLALAGLVVGAATTGIGTKGILETYGLEGTLFGATIATAVLTIEDILLTGGTHPQGRAGDRWGTSSAVSSSPSPGSWASSSWPAGSW
jgi:coenzyme PQQ biosynthesis protein PqqD